MSIHVAMTIFSPFEKSTQPSGFAKNYFFRLAELRLRTFGLQKDVDSYTVLFNYQNGCQVSKDILKLLKDNSDRTNPYQRPIEVIVCEMDPLIHIGSGYLQGLLDTGCDWIYFTEDGHVIPTTVTSVSKPFYDVVQFRNRFFVASKHFSGISDFCNDFDVVVDSYIGIGSWEDPWYPPGCEFLKDTQTFRCKEWGLYQSNRSLKQKIYHEPSQYRIAHGILLAYQGLNVIGSPSHSMGVIHHDLTFSGLMSWDLYDFEWKTPVFYKAPYINQHLIDLTRQKVEAKIKEINIVDRFKVGLGHDT